MKIIDADVSIEKIKSLPIELDAETIQRCIEVLSNMSSAQPERQRGRWIEYIPEHGKCPFCGNQVDLLNGKANNFCSECGANMRGGAE